MKISAAAQVLLVVFGVIGLHLGTTNTFGQPRSATSGTQTLSSFSFYRYKPKVVTTLHDLPPDIESQVVKHLKARLGDEFYSKLVFIEGIAIDLTEMMKAEPERKSYKWTPPNYALLFTFSDAAKGLKYYRANLELDSNGEVLKEISIPEVSRHPEKATIIALKKAVNIAVQNGFPRKKMIIRADYDTNDDSIIWYAEGPERSYGGSGCRDIITINAHSGRVLQKKPVCGIY